MLFTLSYFIRRISEGFTASFSNSLDLVLVNNMEIEVTFSQTLYSGQQHKLATVPSRGTKRVSKDVYDLPIKPGNKVSTNLSPQTVTLGTSSKYIEVIIGDTNQELSPNSIRTPINSKSLLVNNLLSKPVEIDWYSANKRGTVKLPGNVKTQITPSVIIDHQFRIGDILDVFANGVYVQKVSIKDINLQSINIGSLETSY